MHQVMEWNEDVSEKVRAVLREKRVCLVNVMGSPGAGKTSLLTALMRGCAGTFSIGVIEGDIAGRLTRKKSPRWNPGRTARHRRRVPYRSDEHPEPAAGI